MMHLQPRHAVWIVVVTLALIFVFLHSGLDFDYVIPKRIARLTAMLIGGAAIAWSSITFQTLTGNRILTPAIMGYEAVYLLWQALLILFMGSASLVLLGVNGNFVLSVLQGFSQASFNRAQPLQLLFSGLLVGAVCLLGRKTLPTLDVLCLGRDQAVSLGVDYRRNVRLHLALIAILVAVSTSLLGPTAFMGVFVANITYALARTFRHRVTLPLGGAIATGMFITAQLLVEHVFNYKTTVGILVNLVCGGYFLVLMVRTRGAP
ncbi:iron chelate uptake ABC transporter family permease subunit [Pseudomonas sp. TWR2-1-1]|uniref:iron chelate uptake ABC transporter family permease subunit n=1 Tax=Pseudomonas sp. TWR2-1-1 TaxID=2804610 RepID=UPI003CFB16C3